MSPWLGKPEREYTRTRKVLMEWYLLPHVVPVLCSVDASFERRRPTGGGDGGTLVLWAFERLEVDQERDRVLSFGDTIVWFAGGNPGGSAGYHTSGDRDILEDPAADINMMRREVIAGQTK